MQAQRPYWFIQRQRDGLSQIRKCLRDQSTGVCVKTVVKECDYTSNCCLCNRELDDHGRWHVYHCCNEALFYVCPNEDCSLLMEVEGLDYDCLFMQYADSDVWYMLECTYSATD